MPTVDLNQELTKGDDGTPAYELGAMLPEGQVIRAAGVLLAYKDKMLILQRQDGSGWCLAGGKAEDGESAEECAARECFEETGYKPQNLKEFSRRIKDGVDFTTFTCECDELPSIVIEDEHTGFAWVTPEEALEYPLHRGMEAVLTKLRGNELDVARLIQSGELVSPQRFQNMALFDIRITGTGAAYRSKGQEYVWREPALYLNDNFLARCNGLPVIYEHPEGNILNSDEFGNRVVGTILLPYIKGDEVWGVARIYDDAAIELLSSEIMSTSPAVVLSGDDATVNLDDGRRLLIEGEASLLDHIAICKRGVWDKAGDPRGIISEGVKTMDNVKADEEKGGITLEAVLGEVKNLFGSLTARLDSIEEAAKPKEMAADACDEEKGGPKATADDKKADDGEEDRELAKKADADMEEVKKTIADMQEKMAPKELADSEVEEIADMQYKSDSVTAALGEKPIRAMAGEAPKAYRARVLQKLKAYSDSWKGVDIAAAAKADASILDVAEPKIFADAMAAANSPMGVTGAGLRKRVTRADSGHVVTEFYGDIGETFAPFKQVPLKVASFNNRANA